MTEQQQQQRDPRLPAKLPPAMFSHTDFDRKMDARFEHYCAVRKRFYFLYMLLDVLLIACAYRIGHLALVWFTLISICAIALHLVLVLNLRLGPSRPGKERVIGVARMAAYDAHMHCQSTDMPAMRRFALLTHLSNMPLWHVLTTLDVLVPTFLACVGAFIYFMLALENVFFLALFVATRLLIAMHQYYTLGSFYSAAVGESVSSVIKVHSQAVFYGASRSRKLVNGALERADKYLKDRAAGRYQLPPWQQQQRQQHGRGRGKTRVAETGGAPTFSGVSMPSVTTEITPKAGVVQRV